MKLSSNNTSSVCRKGSRRGLGRVVEALAAHSTKLRRTPRLQIENETKKSRNKLLLLLSLEFFFFLVGILVYVNVFFRAVGILCFVELRKREIKKENEFYSYELRNVSCEWFVTRVNSGEQTISQC